MAQATSELWKQLIRDRNTRREFKFEVNGRTYGDDAEVSHTVSGGLYESFGIGNASAASLTLVLEADDIPKGATVRRFVRLVLDDQATEWLPKGVFFANRRSEDDGLWTIEAFDALRKAAVPFIQEGYQEEWPQPATSVVATIARRMGVSIDPRTNLDPTVMVGYPNDLTMQTILGHIAAAHFSNWVMSDAGELRLVPLLSVPAPTSLLVDEHGDYIAFGEVRLIV